MNKRLTVSAVALVGLTAIFAISQTKSTGTPRRYINVDRNPALKGLPFSNAVLVGDTLYISGRIGLDPKTGKPPADVEQEARLALDSIQATLKEAGMTMDDLVSVQIYCSDVSNYDKFNAVYRTYFRNEFPARAFLGSGNLLFGGRFEVMGIAMRK